MMMDDHFDLDSLNGFIGEWRMLDSSQFPNPTPNDGQGRFTLPLRH